MLNTLVNLKKAEQIAVQLFEEVQKRKLVCAGKTEQQLNREVYELAKILFGIEKHWHKRIVRAGVNTLFPYKENPHNQVIQADDILFFDFGPVVEQWEADVGRTYVLGNNPMKLKLKKDIEQAWHETKAWFQQYSAIRACDIFNYAVQKAASYGWTFGGEIAGHIIGEFPHESLAPGDVGLYIHPDNMLDILALDANNNKRHWILEMHFIDKEHQIGGFYEQLLV